MLGALVPLLALGGCARGESTPLVIDTPARARADSLRALVAEDTLRDVDTLGVFVVRDIAEASGLARSSVQAGAFWTLNDSNNDERLFAFDRTGADLGTVVVAGSRNRDWEALALGACDAGRCLYVGDVGDNDARHRTIRVWRISEPVPPGAGRTVTSEPARRLDVAYPGGPRDVEAMWVDADTVLWLATKRPLRDAAGASRPSLVYRVAPEAWRGGGPAVAELVDSLPVVPSRDEDTQVTDASLRNPLGAAARDSVLAIRTYGWLYLFRVHGTSGRPGALLARCRLAPLRERQGEAVTWLDDGRLLFASEKRGAPLQAARCP